MGLYVARISYALIGDESKEAELVKSQLVALGPTSTTYTIFVWDFWRYEMREARQFACPQKARDAWHEKTGEWVDMKILARP